MLTVKYRPEKFEDILGNDEVIEVLKGMKEKKIYPRLLVFSGKYGCGKTSIVYVLKNELGAEMVEIDGANTNVDILRGLIERVEYKNEKVWLFVIDEAQRLNRIHYDSILKVVESDMNEKIMWILVTNEIYKLPKTIRSRAMEFEIKMVNREVLLKHLEMINREEGLGINIKILEKIVEVSKSIRDAIMMLDKIRYVDEDKQDIIITNDYILAVEIIDSVIRRQVQRGMDIVKQVSSIREVLDNMIEITNDMLLYNMGVRKEFVDNKILGRLTNQQILRLQDCIFCGILRLNSVIDEGEVLKSIILLMLDCVKGGSIINDSLLVQVLQALLK